MRALTVEVTFHFKNLNKITNAEELAVTLEQQNEFSKAAAVWKTRAG